MVYVGRLDGEKKPDLVVDAFRRLPASLGAKVALIGEGPLKAEIAALGDDRIIMPGYCKDRSELARWLASSDIYVSGMADETFGISIVEAQASGLPVVGVAAGAMIDRVTDATGRLGPVGDAQAMTANILSVWDGDRQALAAQARAHALQFSWDSSMEALFGRLYPAAFATARGTAVARHRRRPWFRPDRTAGSPTGWTRPTRSWSRCSRASRACLPTTRPLSLIMERRPIWQANASSRSSIPGQTCPSIWKRLRRQSALGRSSQSCARTPIATIALRLGRWRNERERRSSVARRSRSRRWALEPMRRSMAIMRPTECSKTKRRSKSTANRWSRSRPLATRPTIYALPIARPCSAAIM